MWGNSMNLSPEAQQSVTMITFVDDCSVSVVFGRGKTTTVDEYKTDSEDDILDKAEWTC